MRRLAFLLILLLLIPSISQARPRGIYRTVASGSVTQANMRLSGVDGGATASGGAFVDFGYKYQSDFSAGADGWFSLDATVTGNIDGIGGQDNSLRVACNTNKSTHVAYKTSFFVGTKKYKITFSYYIPSGQSNVDSIYLPIANYGANYTFSVLDTWTTVTVNKTPTANTALVVMAADGGLSTFTDAGGDDVFYIKDVKVEENPPTSYLGHLLKITDSAGNSIMGYIKAAMAGESLDTEVATGTLTALKLYKITATEANHFGTGKVVGSYFTSAGTETCDANNKVQCVLVGAATGVTIVSSKGGATYNWFNKNSAFNWNDASGYTYQIIKENRTVVPDSRIHNVYTSDFSAGVDGWSARNGAVDGNIDSIGGEDNWLRYTNDNTNTLHRAVSNRSLVVGKRYTITFKYYIPSGQSNVNSISLWDYTNPLLVSSTLLNVTDTVTTYTKTFTAANTDGIRFYAGNGVAYQDAGGDDVFYIKDVVINSEPILTISAGNALMDTTTDNAFAAPVGVDLTAYQDGRHLAHFTDSSGYVAVGWISATAPSGEALGAEINSGTLTISKLYKITATEANHFGTGYLVDRYFTSLGIETCDANNKVKENTMPAATGALLLSSKGGSRGYLYKHDSFNPNGALTLKILFMGD